MSQTLPFNTFLDVLRDKGYAVSLHEHLAVAKLLERWDRTHVPELRDAMAALIGRNEDEVDGIGRLFDDVFRDTAPALQVQSAAVQDRRGPFPWRWALAGGAGAAVVATLVWRTTIVTPPALPPPPAVAVVEQPLAPTRPPQAASTPETRPSTRRPTVPGAVPKPPDLPEPPTVLERAVVAQVAGAGFFVALGAAWYAKKRRVMRGWLQDAWRSALAARPGPFHPQLIVRGVTWRLPRFQVEDAAVILGRIFGTDARARELDVKESLRLTLRRGLLPHLVFKRIRTARPIVVLEDVSYSMDFWREKLGALLHDLARQGIGLERWYFDGDPRHLADRPRGTLVPLEIVIGRRPDSPVLILSTGSGLAPVIDSPDGTWLKALSQRPRSAWVTPFVDSRFWPEALTRLPIPVWPMTRLGLTHAARALAGFDVSTVIRTRVLAEGRVTEDDVERVKRLASLVPHPTVELLEFLRQRFAADVPDAAVAHLFAQAGSEGLPVLRLSEEELARCTTAVRVESPRLEAAVRREIIEVLRGSEPPADSAAHLRWQMAIGLQEVALAHVQGGDPATPLAALQTLRGGPIWEEVAVAAKRVPGLASLGNRPRSPRSRGGAHPPPDDGHLRRWTARPRSWPGLGELLSATTTMAVLCIGAWMAGVFPTRTFAHVPSAYQLTYVPGETVISPKLDLRLGEGAYPRTVDLYRDNQRIQTGLALPIDGPLSIELPPDATGSYYQARATLPDGNLALSAAVWIPPDSLIVVLIDAQPWARVTIDGGSTHLEPGATPVSVPLAPGTYRLQLENGGLTPSRNEEIVVGSGNQEFRFLMPGFDPARTADNVLGTPAR